MDYDNEIRFKLEKSQKFQKKIKDGFMIEEWKVRNSIIDIAIINGNLIGYEIKSKNDTLSRLSKQMVDYISIFDKITIIADRDHVVKIKTMIPSYVGIMLAENNFPTERVASFNEDVDYSSIASLLYKEELFKILTSYGFKKIKSKSRSELACMMSAEFEKKTQELVRNQLKDRKTQGWRDYSDPWDKYINDPSLIPQPPSRYGVRCHS